MIDFYSLYNKTDLDMEEYRPLIAQIIDQKYTTKLLLVKHIIMRNPEYAYWYSVKVIKGRWYEAEPHIKNSYWAFSYAENVIKGRWPEAEPYIMKAPVVAYFYAYYVLQSRWPEAEQYIQTDQVWWMSYKSRFNL